MKPKKTIYLIDNKISWKAFKAGHDKIVKDDGPKPQNIERVLWKMIKEKKILAGFATDIPDDMWLSLEIPKRYKGWKWSLIK